MDKYRGKQIKSDITAVILNAQNNYVLKLLFLFCIFLACLWTLVLSCP